MSLLYPSPQITHLEHKANPITLLRPTVPRLRRRRLQGRRWSASLHLHPRVRSEGRYRRIHRQDCQDGQHNQRHHRHQSHRQGVRGARQGNARRQGPFVKHRRGAHALQLRSNGRGQGATVRVADTVGKFTGCHGPVEGGDYVRGV